MSESRILFPTDFSERSTHALKHAVALADALGGKIVLLHVAAPLQWPIPQAPRLRLELLEASENQLRRLRNRWIGAKQRSHVQVVQGIPHEEIAAFAAHNGIDTIVISTHGHGSLKRFLLGSTVERVVRGAPCSVLVIRTTERAKVPPGAEVRRRMLVATDFSELSLAATRRAVVLGRRVGAEIILLHVLREPDPSTKQLLKAGFADAWEELRKSSQARLAALEAAEIGDAVPSRRLLTEGVPSAAIADAAVEENADVIILGARGHTGAARFNLGSTVERVVRIAPCSVLVVKAVS